MCLPVLCSIIHFLCVCVCEKKIPTGKDVVNERAENRRRWRKSLRLIEHEIKRDPCANLRRKPSHKMSVFFVFFFSAGSRFSFCLLQILLISLFLPARLFLETSPRARQSVPLCPLTSSLYRCLSPSQLLVMNPSHFFDFRCGEASRGPRVSCIKRANQYSFRAWRMICHWGRGENNV